MRAIAGLWSSGSPAAPEDCVAMLAAMSASPASVSQAAPSVILGSSDYRPSPPSPSGTPPQQSDRPQFVASRLVADLRIDNHDDLVRELGLPPTASDDELLAHAWTRWGFSIVDHLIGGFAFACWGPAHQTLFLARDHVGERPLYFARTLGPDGRFAFASTPPGLCALSSVNRRIHTAAMAHFLAALSPVGTETFFEGVERLLPGHWMKVSPVGIEIRRYWHPVPSRPIRYLRDSDYVEDFRERFDRAVADRLSGTDGIASQLSAGLDSSSVTVTAARLLAKEGRRLTSFTAVPMPGYDGSALTGRFGDEGPMASEVAALYPNIDHVLINTAGRDLLASSRRDSRLTGQPTFNPTNMLWIDATLDGMRSRGLSVLLSATGGNATTSFGGLIGLSELFRRGRWLKLLRLTRELRAGGHTSWRGAAGWATGWIIPQRLRRLYHPTMRGFSLSYSAVHPQIEAKYGLREHAVAEFFGVESSTASVRRNLYEYYDPGIHNAAAAAGWQVEQRDATMDKRIFDFCFGIPIEQYLAGGQSRSIIRRAMESQLPESTLRRTTRGMQSADWYMTLRAARPQLSAELTRIEHSPLACHILDVPRLRTLLDTLPDSGYHSSEVSNAWHLALTRGIAAGSFLAQHDPEMPQDEMPQGEQSAAATEKPSAALGF
jgi:asparagine synthase (glutamine-hydrolysing)